MTAALYTEIFVSTLIFLLLQRRFVILPKAELALAIRAAISASCDASLLTMLPRYLKSETAFSCVPSIKIAGGICALPRAGWYKTSVFLMLIVRPNLRAAEEKQSHSRCKASAESAAKAHSSATVRSSLHSGAAVG